MTTFLPRHVLCVLGYWPDLAAIDSVLKSSPYAGFTLDREYSRTTPDERMPSAFAACAGQGADLTDEDWNVIEGHTTVAYVLSPPIQPRQEMAISGQALMLVAELFHHGAVAIKSESAGMAHGHASWVNLAKAYEQAVQQADTHAQGATLFWAWVKRIIQDDDCYYTCGMHLLGHPDIQVANGIDTDSALEWIDMLGLYLTADRPQRPLLSGEGFRLHNNGPRRILSFSKCDHYSEDDFMHNPFGFVRLNAQVI